MQNPYRELSQVNPQRDNGHRRINNDVWASLVKAKLPGSVYQVVMYVIDRSWGYGQLDVSLGYSQICKATSLSKRAVITAVQIAEKNHLLVVDHGSTKTMSPNCYLFNKHYDTWVTSEVNSTNEVNSTSEVNNTRTSEVSGNFTSEVLTHKVSLPIRNTKENRKDDIYTDNINKENNMGGRKPLGQQARATDPDRFVKGKYGHMVQR